MNVCVLFVFVCLCCCVCFVVVWEGSYFLFFGVGKFPIPIPRPVNSKKIRCTPVITSNEIEWLDMFNFHSLSCKRISLMFTLSLVDIVYTKSYELK